MIFFTWSSDWPMPSEPSASCAGQAILVSSTMTGPGCSLSSACSTIFSDSCSSCLRTRKRPQQSASVDVGDVEVVRARSRSTASVLRRSQGRPALRRIGPVTPRARQPCTSRWPTPCVRACQIGLPVSRSSMPVEALAAGPSSSSRIFSTAPGGRSCATPPGRKYAWFIRRPVTISSTSRMSSRSRKPLVMAVSAPSSMPPVAKATRWLEIRLSSMQQHADGVGALAAPRCRAASRPRGSSPSR